MTHVTLALAVQTNDITYIQDSNFVTNPVNQYLVDQFEYHYSMRWPAFVISLAFAIMLRLVVAIATKYLHFQKR